MSNTATFNTSPNLKLSKKLSFGEEVANSVTHAVGAVAMLVLLPITAVHANNGYGMTAAVGMSVFVISLFLMFLSSAIYHAMDYNIIVLQWGTTIFGILYKIFAKKINEKFSLFLYLMMGWLVIFIIPAIVTKTGPAFWGLMLAGGLSYTVGAAFYAKKKPYFHMIWHLFIMLASALQYMGIVYFMLP